MPNVMVALPNIGGALYSTPQSLPDAQNYMACTNAAKTHKNSSGDEIANVNFYAVRP